MAGKMDKFKGIIKSLMSQHPSQASAEDMMASRKKKLETMGSKKMGGMLDIIYKKRKEREEALGSIDY